MNVDDLNRFEDNSLIEADLGIVGTGPVGVSITRQFAGTKLKVLLLESGGTEEESSTQALYDIETALPRRMNQDKNDHGFQIQAGL